MPHNGLCDRSCIRPVEFFVRHSDTQESEYLCYFHAKQAGAEPVGKPDFLEVVR